MAKVSIKKQCDPKRVTKAIAKDTGSKSAGGFASFPNKSNPKEIKKYSSNGRVASIGKKFKNFLGI